MRQRCSKLTPEQRAAVYAPVESNAGVGWWGERRQAPRLLDDRLDDIDVRRHLAENGGMR